MEIVERNKTKDNLNNQNAIILHHLQTHKSGLNVMYAINKYGITRLSARIYELKDKGHNIVRKDKFVKNRYGHKAKVSTYFLEENDG